MRCTIVYAKLLLVAQVLVAKLLLVVFEKFEIARAQQVRFQNFEISRG